MAIPESQLITWSHQGSITQSSTTYNTIKGALEVSSAPYADKNYQVFLQGSYGNDTNIYAESDVDIVIKLNDSFQSDLSLLTDYQKTVFQNDLADATYAASDFKKDVRKVLVDKYGGDVTVGAKAIVIAGNVSRRKADVITAMQFRRYFKFNGIQDQSYEEGICFYNAAGERIANYPKQHATNCTTKHQNTNKWFKPMVRVVKNIRGKMIEDGLLEAGIAPSYYIEGLLYNVPNKNFGTSYEDSMLNSINWLRNADRSKFVCPNNQYMLLDGNINVTWNSKNCDLFLNGIVELWNGW